jgi:hypothetical protein
MKGHVMKTGRIFWGTLLVLVGLFLFLDKANILNLEWHHVWRFWPLIFILWGIALLVKNPTFKWIAAVLSALLVALFISGFIGFGFLNFGWSKGTAAVDQEFTEPFASTIQKASFSLDAAAGTFVVEDTTQQLVEASVHSSIGKYRLERSGEGGQVKVRLSREGKSMSLHSGHVKNRVEVKLNPNPLWNMDFDIGAAQCDLDLTPYRTERVKIDAGAASVRLKLGALSPETRVDIDAGASSLKIAVPESAGCDIEVDAGLSSKSFPGFEKMKSGTYRTENFENADHKIHISVDAGVSSIKVVRY